MVVLAPADIEALDKAFRTENSSARANVAHDALLAIRRTHSGASPEALLAGILRALATRNRWGESILHYQPDTVPLTLHAVGLSNFPRVLGLVLRLPQPSDPDPELFKHSLMTFMREAAKRYTARNNETVARRIVELVNADDPWEHSVGLAVAAPMLSEVLSTLSGDDEQLFQFARGLHRAWLDAPFHHMLVADANFAQLLRDDIARAVNAWHAPSARYFAPLIRLPFSYDPVFAAVDKYPVVPFLYLANPTDGLMTQQFVHNNGEYLVNWLDEYGLAELAMSPDYDRDALDAVGEAFRDDLKNIDRLMTASVSMEAHPEVCAFLASALAARFPETARERHRDYLQRMEQSVRAAATTTVWELPTDNAAYNERLRYAAWVGRYSPELRPMVMGAFLDTLEWLVNRFAETSDDETQQRHKFARTAKEVAEYFAHLNENDPYAYGMRHADFETEPMAYTLALAGHWLAVRDPSHLLGLPNDDMRRTAMFQNMMRHKRFKQTVCGD